VAHVRSGQTAGWIRIRLGTEVGLGPGRIVLVGNPAPPTKKAQPPIFAHVRSGQTAGGIKMQLGTEVSLGPDHIVLDGDLVSPPSKGAQQRSPNFQPTSTVAKRLDGLTVRLCMRGLTVLGAGTLPIFFRIMSKL